jgi:uncharacterized membrane protein
MGVQYPWLHQFQLFGLGPCGAEDEVQTLEKSVLEVGVVVLIKSFMFLLNEQFDEIFILLVQEIFGKFLRR